MLMEGVDLLRIQHRLELVQVEAEVCEVVEVLQQPDGDRQVEGANPYQALRLDARSPDSRGTPAFEGQGGTATDLVPHQAAGCGPNAAVSSDGVTERDRSGRSLTWSSEAGSTLSLSGRWA